MSYEIETTVLGGLPVTVEYSVGEADPSCGFPNDAADDWWIVSINGRPLRKSTSADWLYKRIKAVKGEWDRILDECQSDFEHGRAW